MEPIHILSIKLLLNMDLFLLLLKKTERISISWAIH